MRSADERVVQIEPAKNRLPPWDGEAWDSLAGMERKKEARCMEIYAAMLDCVDRNVGRIIARLKEQGKFDHTLICFASDNGGCAEDAKPNHRSERLEDFGTVASYETVGGSWAIVQNTPLRKWKNFSHEGGIRTPFIVSWPNRIRHPGSIIREPAHLIDVMPTLVAVAGARYPDTFRGKPVTPMQGVSLLPALDGKTLAREGPFFWQWAQGGAIRQGDMKAVFWGDEEERAWELYDLSQDQNEMKDLALEAPEMLDALSTRWVKWYGDILPTTDRRN